MKETIDPETLYDAVVIGGGPAGLCAALYLARARYRVLVVEKDRFGGQITITAEVVNYPGILKTSGEELTKTMRRQAEAFGAEFLLGEVIGLSLTEKIKTVHTARGDLHAFCVLVATGAHPREIGFEGEAEFRGHGVAYCATCDGEFFTDKEVFVVGGGFAAAEESVFLAKYARHVTVLVRESDFTCAAAVAEAPKRHEKITVLYHTEVERVAGDQVLRSIRYRNNESGEVTEYKAAEGDTFGVFVFAGYAPETSLLQGVADLDEQGYVLTDRAHQTSVEGLYAAGDVCVKNLRQVVTAVSDGAIAATEMERYAASMQRQTGLHPPFRAGKAETPSSRENTTSDEKALFSDAIHEQLDSIFARMTKPLLLKLYLDERPVSEELKAYMEALAEKSDKLRLETAENGEEAERPCVRVCRADGTWTGLAFHGVPGGHEFSSFILGLYNAAGPGQTLEEATLRDIARLSVKTDMQILVSLSCTMCPELVTAAQLIALKNPLVSACVYDINCFPALKEQYRVMSVPCLVVNGRVASFGKKNLRQLLDLLLEENARS